MLTISHDIDCPLPDQRLLPAPLDQILFLDIETTGFSPASSSLYLIGIMIFQQGKMNLTQLFATRLSEEEELLRTFMNNYLCNYSYIVHFNGEQFDVPYLEKCANAYGIQLPFASCIQFDILKQVRAMKKLLGLTSCRQKSVEQFLRIHRNDRFDGGQLIPVYQQYLRTHNEDLLQTLLLHNAEDVSGMLQLLPILSYEKLLHSFHVATVESFQIMEQSLEITLKSPFSVPIPVHTTEQNCSISIGKCFVTLEIPLFFGELKYYYPDYKEYYYLPEEDLAIHQKIAMFVPKERKKKATRLTAYAKKSGVFVKLPLPSSKNETCPFPCLQTDWKSKERFVLLEENESFLHKLSMYTISTLFPI